MTDPTTIATYLLGLDLETLEAALTAGDLGLVRYPNGDPLTDEGATFLRSLKFEQISSALTILAALSATGHTDFEGDNTMTTTHTSPALTPWIDEIAAIRERVLNDRVTSVDDPRLQLLEELGAIAPGLSRETLGQYIGDDEHTFEHLAFKHLTDKPELPLPMPEWATKRRVSFAEWPEIEVVHSTEIVTDGLVVGVDHQVTIFAAEVVDSFLDPVVKWRKGDVTDGGALRFYLGTVHRNVDLELTSAGSVRAIGEAITELANRLAEGKPRELHRITEPGEPELAGIGGGL